MPLSADKCGLQGVQPRLEPDRVCFWRNQEVAAGQFVDARDGWHRVRAVVWRSGRVTIYCVCAGACWIWLLVLVGAHQWLPSTTVGMGTTPSSSSCQAADSKAQWQQMVIWLTGVV